MEKNYYHEWIESQNQLEKTKLEITELKEQVSVLQKLLSNAVNEVYSLATEIEDYPCGKDCGCKGTFLKDSEQLLP